MDRPVFRPSIHKSKVNLDSGIPYESTVVELEIVVPLWNEEEIIPELHRRIAESASQTGLVWRAIYVDDGSTDRSPELLAELVRKNEPVHFVRLSRNFGQPAAIHAGLSASTADAVVLLDGDLQDPPELIHELVNSRRGGAEIVIARRRSRTESSFIRKTLFTAFHKVFSGLSDIRVPANCGTYSLLGRRAVDAILALPEAHRYFPGLRAWVGFRQEFVEYDRAGRAAGDPRQTLRRLVRYAGDAIFGYSSRPVAWMGYSAIFSALIGGTSLTTAFAIWLGTGFGLGMMIATGLAVLGWFAAIQFACLAFVAELVRRIYEQVKLRPMYLIESETGTGIVTEQKSSHVAAA